MVPAYSQGSINAFPTVVSQESVAEKSDLKPTLQGKYTYILAVAESGLGWVEGPGQKNWDNYNSINNKL